MHDLSPYRPALAAFAGRWRVAELALFGSALCDDFGPESDVDLLLTFEDGETWSLLDLVQMKLELASLFGRLVDLVGEAASRNPVWRRVILDSAQMIEGTLSNIRRA